MPIIRQLPTSLINKIAAGEVIERPASVVKELMENSVDAGAKRIEVTIENGGGDLIRISDDGCGIEPEQLPLALASHATSKLPDDDALFSVRTLGFRGEALASIAGVSHLLMRSRTRNHDAASEVEVRGGEMTGPAPCAAPVGTVIEVRNLFFNTPVRRKFLRSSSTEMGHITEAFTRIALAFPQVHFRLVSGTRELYDLHPTERWSERIGAFFGTEVSDALIPVSGEDGDVRMRGYVCEPAVNRSNNRLQYLFLNGRHIRDRALQHALGEAYRGLLMVGRFPVCFLHLDMPPDLVDVNVHPTKLEVRFADGGRIYGKLLQTLRHTFLSTDLTARVRTSLNSSPSSVLDDDRDADAQATSAVAAALPQQAELPWRASLPASNTTVDLMALGGRVPDFRPYPDGNAMVARAAPSPATANPASARSPDLSSSGVVARRDVVEQVPWQRIDSPPAGHTGESPRRLLPGETAEMPSIDHPHPSSTTSQPPAEQNLATDAVSQTSVATAATVRALTGIQIHNRYLVTQDDRGMVVIDQHALHERIMYERIREKVLGARLECQRLLVPEPVTLTPAEAAVALDSQELLAKVGIEIEPFGGDAVLVRSYPAMLSRMSPSDMLRQALESLIAAGRNPEVRDLLDHLLHTIACKAAIKAGDPLNGDEVDALLEQRHLFQDTHHCPHGRPTALYFSRDELDRMFGRLGPRKIS